MLSDIEIAQAAKMQPITEIAAKLGLQGEDVIPYGHYKAKLNHLLAKADKPEGKLVLVTAISPTPAGEGKTTTSVGLADAMNALGKKTMLCLREPSLGPVFGIKGGAAGGGYAQVVPMEDINLHFTGDIHAIGAANNLLAAMMDNSHPAGQRAEHRPAPHHLEALHGHERPPAAATSSTAWAARSTAPRARTALTSPLPARSWPMFCLADRPERPERAAVPHRLSPTPTTASPSPPARSSAAGAMTALLKDALRPQPGADAGEQPRHDPRRPLRQHCPRLQQRHCHQAEPEAGRLCDYRSRLRRRPGRGEVPGHQVPRGRAASRRRGAGCYRPCAEASTAALPKPDLSKPNAEAVKAGAVNLARHIENIAGLRPAGLRGASTPSPPTPRRRWPSSTTSAPRPVCPAR